MHFKNIQIFQIYSFFEKYPFCKKVQILKKSSDFYKVSRLKNVHI
jgi:hypothetical protein